MARKKVPDFLRLKERMAALGQRLGELEGTRHLDPQTLTSWTYWKETGWQYSGSIKDLAHKPKKYVEIPERVVSTERNDAGIPTTHELQGIHRIEEKLDKVAEAIDAQQDQWVYTMLSWDNRVLKIGETRGSELKTKDKGIERVKTVQEFLEEDRYGGKKNGGPYIYVAHEAGTKKKEKHYKDHLIKVCGIDPLQFPGNKKPTKEYFPAKEALEALRAKGGWPLGYLESITPEPKSHEQGNLFPPTE